jgi:arylsulfatase A-like enzyme
MSDASSMTRRDVLKASTAPIMMALGSRLSFAALEPPNILFIMVDDMGYADLSCYGRRDYKTPNIDRLAAGGVRFTQAYANSPVSSATRTALMTGRYQYRIPVGLEEPLGMRDVGLPPEHPTLPSLLKKAGYGTMLIGKWHLGNRPNYGPRKSGYEHFWGFYGGGTDYFTHKGNPAKDAPGDLWNDDERIQVPGYLTDLLADQAIQAIDGYARAKQPFMISLHFNAPHWPWQGPDDEALSRLLRPMYSFDNGSLKTYASMVTRLDFQVGRVMKALETAGVAKNTIVIFTSDNGGERFSDTWPHTGKKTELLEGGLKVPALIHWPGRLPAGLTTEQVAISMDWMPTLLSAAGVSPAPDYAMDGMNLLPVLARNAKPVLRKLFWRYKYNSQSAVRYGNMKFLRIGKNTFLFNVAEDPLERANLKDRQPDVYKRLMGDWDAWNKTMLNDPKAGSVGFTSSQLADHFISER